MYDMTFMITMWKLEMFQRCAEYRELIRRIYMANEIHLRDSIKRKYSKRRAMNRIIRIRSPGMGW